MTPPQPKRITTLPAAPLALSLSFPFFIFLFIFRFFFVGPAILFLIRTISIPQRCLSPFPLSSSLFLPFHFLRIPSFPILRLSISFCLILPFLRRFSFTSCKYLSVYSNVVLPLYLLSGTSPSTLCHYYTSSICRPTSTASNTSTLTSPTCKITITEAAPGGVPRWPPRTLSVNSVVSRA
jgi:hypothetical protein